MYGWCEDEDVREDEIEEFRSGFERSERECPTCAKVACPEFVEVLTVSAWRFSPWDGFEATVRWGCPGCHTAGTFRAARAVSDLAE